MSQNANKHFNHPILNKASILVFVLGLSFGLTPWILTSREATAQARPGASRGAGHAGIVLEDYQFTSGRKKSSVRTQRDLIVVDQRYGAAFAVTSEKGRSILWYRANDGTIHNVIIENALAPVRIIRQ